jgi:SanA protein
MILLGAGAVAMLAGASLVADRWIAARAAPFTAATVETLPTLNVALVLGTSPLGWTGRPNQFFERRLDAAAELFRHGKVRFLIVSGDRRDGYDEPLAMRAGLIARGVPESAIYRDPFGARTLDSVLRVRSAYGQVRVIFVSQRFHTERAVFLARRNGLEAWGYEAADVSGALGLLPRLREYASRLRAVWDVARGTRARQDGPAVAIGVDPPS